MDIDILTTEELKQLHRDIDTRLAKRAVEKRIEEQRKLIGCYFLEQDGNNFVAFRVDKLTRSGSLYGCCVECCYDSDYFAVMDKICGCDGYTQIDENKWNELVNEVMSVIAQKLNVGENDD